jgi:hypothetical protein
MTVDDIQTTEADFETMEAETPKPKKAAKKAAKTTANSTEQARDRVKAKLLAAGRPNKDDMLSRQAHDD